MTRHLLIILLLAIGLCSCHSVDEWDDDPEGNFEALWTILDRHYCFFEEKGVDWNEVYAKYRPQVKPKTNYLELYNICGDMLAELEDGHVNLMSWFSTTYYKKWWSDYPQNYDNRLVEEHYFHFGGLQRNGLKYTMLRDSVAYMRYPSFSTTPGESTLDWALALLGSARGLIIDVRDNGGGIIANVEMIASRFIADRTLAGYICHKNGPGHSDFSKPYPFYFEVPEAGRIRWNKPVVVLANRSTFSAANNFVAVMKLLPGVTVIGDRTGGGSGMPFNSELPCGWTLRFSGSPVYDANMNSTESGVEPDIHLDLDLDAVRDGIDTMIEKAIDTLIEQTPDYKDPTKKDK